MTFRTILTVAGLERGDHDIDLAASLCEEASAHLSVFVVAFAAPPPVGTYAAMISDAWVQERQADAERLEERLAAITARLSGREVSADISGVYPETAWADDVIGRRGRYCDLTLLGPELLSGGMLKDKIVEGALFWSGKPVLLVPEGASATLQPKRVMVAWDSRIEASRAVRESLGILKTAEEVRLVLVDPEEGEDAHGDEPGADAAVYLVRHGVRVGVDRLPSAGRPVVEVLRRHALDIGADMIVMGAYGHSRLRQRILGGVTRSMIEEPPLPVLMAR
ncbi:MAG: universal stress protein [Aquamicrobium sp.]|uniref:universal stress protein n=1 Tax=Aquamicrobium sp. TaxID=1872579 RepID=UPI00349EB734|nr:universal stress protein [Aquamicrobium sp.]